MHWSARSVRTSISFITSRPTPTSRAVSSDPTLDFENSIVATFSLLRAMRHHGIKKLVYTSGSGVYGDRGVKFLPETHGPLEPVSMYGASKMSAEGLISAFVHLFDMQAWIVRPANIIGPRSTHGVVYDFMRKLRKDPAVLNILGDGKQSKAYLHVDDVIDALLLIQKKAAKAPLSRSSTCRRRRSSRSTRSPTW